MPHERIMLVYRSSNSNAWLYMHFHLKHCDHGLIIQMHLQILYPNTVYDTVNIYHSAISTDLFYVHATVVLGHFPIGSSSPLKTAVCGRGLINVLCPRSSRFSSNLFTNFEFL